MQISGCRGEGKDQRNGHGRQVCKRIQKEVAIGFEIKLNGRKKILAINTAAVSVLRYGAGFLQWTSDELKNMDRILRKIMKMYCALHPNPKSDTGSDEVAFRMKTIVKGGM